MAARPEADRRAQQHADGEEGAHQLAGSGNAQNVHQRAVAEFSDGENDAVYGEGGCGHHGVDAAGLPVQDDVRCGRGGGDADHAHHDDEQPDVGRRKVRAVHMVACALAGFCFCLGLHVVLAADRLQTHFRRIVAQQKQHEQADDEADAELRPEGGLKPQLVHDDLQDRREDDGRDAGAGGYDAQRGAAAFLRPGDCHLTGAGDAAVSPAEGAAQDPADRTGKGLPSAGA